MEAWHDRDEQKMRMVFDNYFESLRELRNGWRKLQLEKDLKKNEVMLLQAKQREEERQQTDKRKRDQEAQEAATAKAKPTTAPEAQASAATATSSMPNLRSHRGQHEQHLYLNEKYNSLTTVYKERQKDLRKGRYHQANN
eukprot:2684141-Amphidinium_carterae.2